MSFQAAIKNKELIKIKKDRERIKEIESIALLTEYNIKPHLYPTF